MDELSQKMSRVSRKAPLWKRQLAGHKNGGNQYTRAAKRKVTLVPLSLRHVADLIEENDGVKAVVEFHIDIIRVLVDGKEIGTISRRDIDDDVWRAKVARMITP